MPTSRYQINRNGAEAERGIKTNGGSRARAKKYPNPKALARIPIYAVTLGKMALRNMATDIIRPETVTRLKAQNTPVPKMAGSFKVSNVCPADNNTDFWASVAAAAYCWLRASRANA